MQSEISEGDLCRKRCLETRSVQRREKILIYVERRGETPARRIKRIEKVRDHEYQACKITVRLPEN